MRNANGLRLIGSVLVVRLSECRASRMYELDSFGQRLQTLGLNFILLGFFSLLLPAVTVAAVWPIVLSFLTTPLEKKVKKEWVKMALWWPFLHWKPV